MLAADVGAALAQRRHDPGPSIFEQHSVHDAIPKKADDPGDNAADYHTPDIDSRHRRSLGLPA
jgi:hypothetical protein